MNNLPEVSHIRFGNERSEKAIQACLRNRSVIEKAWPEIQHCLTPATVSQIDEHLSWLDEFLVQEAGKRERTDQQHQKYMLGWAAVLKTVPADITAWAFGKWLERDTAFYPTPGQIKALAKAKAAERRVLHYRAKTAFEYLRDNPDAQPFKDGPEAKAMREKLANLSKGVAKKRQPERLESNKSKQARRVKTINEIKAMHSDAPKQEAS